MNDEDPLLDILLERLDGSALSSEQQVLVWAAFESAEQLQQALEAAIELPHGREPATQQEIARPHAYLQSITVRGFRGIGPEASLRLSPGPGLTLVVGRNGSGKSSVAEGIEVALTGTSYRWKDKTKDWKAGWRNLHRSDDTSLELELVVDGDRGRSRVGRSWPGDDIDKSECWLQRPGQARAPLSTLGWSSALTTYRPFLSYSELGQTIAGKPSEMYDALASILGLERFSAAEQRLNDVRKELDATAKELDRELEPLLGDLRLLDDDRARTACEALTGRARNLAKALAVVSGTASNGDPDEITLLRMMSQLSAPDPDRVAAAVADLRGAVQALVAVRGTAADESRQTADLLQRALEHRERHADHGTCPVCGTRDVLDDGWAAQARVRVETLRRAAQEADDAVHLAKSAVTSAKVLLFEPPRWLPAESAVHQVWASWAAGAALDDPKQLADHLERTLPSLLQACAQVRTQAEQGFAELEGRWQPLSRRLAGWLERAQAAEPRRALRNDVKKANDWLREVGLDLRNDRLRPLAEQSSRIWQQLRQDSNVQLGPIQLAGKSTQRRVMLDVTVDGIEGTALGVMSQGELHALALSLFLPRATMAESPFGFLVIDDPVQSMDPAKVDGLARLLSQTAIDRQVIVFTHDTRLPDAIRRLNLSATIWEVVRRENSVVELRKADDPPKRALDDARALLHTSELPVAVGTRVVPALCRTALEAGLVEAVWQRRLSDGSRHAQIEAEIAAARGAYELAALAFFGDAGRTGEVLARLNNRYGRWAGDTFHACKSAGHGAYSGDLRALVDDTGRLLESLRGER